MGEDAIVVFTFKTLDQMREDGGCGIWPIGGDPERLSKRGIEYVICVRNRSGKVGAPPEGDEIEHGKPFLLGRLNGAECVDAYTSNGIQKQLLKIGEYIELPHESLPTVRVGENFEYSFVRDVITDFNDLHFAPFYVTSAETADDLSEESSISVIGNDPGPTGNGVRSEAIWSARQSPLVNSIVTYLQGRGYKPADGSPWKPDILMYRDEDERVLIEVKPDFGTHNIITGIGQIICYRNPHEARFLTSIIAGDGISDLSDDLRVIMAQLEIRGLDVADPNWQSLLEKLLAESQQNWRARSAAKIAPMTPKCATQADSAPLVRQDRER